jgi:hypothetical protein
MTFTPSTALSAGTWFRVEVEASAKDDSVPGNFLESGYSWQFETETGDITPPTVIATQPDNNAVDISVDLRFLNITFNESMNQLSVVSGLSITPWVPYETSWSNNSLILTLHEPLEYGTWYTIRINGSVAQDLSHILLDGNGDGVSGDDYLFYFTTEEEVSPEEVFDILPYVMGMLLAVVVILLLLYILKGKTRVKMEEEDEVAEDEEEVDVEEELMGIEELLGIDKDD